MCCVDRLNPQPFSDTCQCPPSRQIDRPRSPSRSARVGLSYRRRRKWRPFSLSPTHVWLTSSCPTLAATRRALPRWWPRSRRRAGRFGGTPQSYLRPGNGRPIRLSPNSRAPVFRPFQIVSSDRLNPLRLRLASLQVRSRQSNLSDDIAARTTSRRRTAHRAIDNGPTVNQTACNGPVDLSLGHVHGKAARPPSLFYFRACLHRATKSFLQWNR